jgi:hypothetical protein
LAAAVLHERAAVVVVALRERAAAVAGTVVVAAADDDQTSCSSTTSFLSANSTTELVSIASAKWQQSPYVGVIAQEVQQVMRRRSYATKWISRVFYEKLGIKFRLTKSGWRRAPACPQLSCRPLTNCSRMIEMP